MRTQITEKCVSAIIDESFFFFLIICESCLGRRGYFSAFVLFVLFFFASIFLFS